jgi:LacI family transcriptional regulator
MPVTAGREDGDASIPALLANTKRFELLTPGIGLRNDWPMDCRPKIGYRGARNVSQRAEMATIRDVAKHARVAIATVSAVLNDSASVSADTRKRVWAAVDAVGYSPNAIARSLRLGKSRLIGIAVADITNPFCSSMVRTMENAAIAAGYSIIVCNTDDHPTRERDVIKQLRSQHVAGIILMPIGKEEDYRKLSEARNLPPIVAVDNKVTGLECDFVGVDNRACARLLTQYLLRLGHRRIAMITGIPGIWTAEERRIAFLQTMEEAGVVDPSMCVAGNYHDDLAYDVTKLLMTRANRPTAIIGANNVTALGALQAILDLGFRCPQDVSLVGIDDVPWGGLVRPRIVTVAQPIADIARTAIACLLERISGAHGADVPPREMIFQPRFVSGDSCLSLGPVEVASNA